MRPTPEHLSEAMVRATEHWETRKRAQAGGPGERGLTIALSRETGARGTTVGRELSRLLGWPVYDYELVAMIARETGLRESLVQSLDERHTSWLRDAMAGWNLLDRPVLGESGYIQHLVETILSLGSHGHCVIVGRGAAFLLPPETTLSVRLVAPLADRVEYVCREFGWARADAEKRVQKTDREREEFVRQYFGKDATIAANYDLLLNAARYTVPQCAELIAEALRRRPAPVPRPAAATGA